MSKINEEHRTKAVAKKNINRRAAEYAVLGFFLIPVLMGAAYLLKLAKSPGWLIVIVFCAIILAAWAAMYFIGLKIKQRQAYIRKIRHAQKDLEAGTMLLSEQTEENNGAK